MLYHGTQSHLLQLEAGTLSYKLQQGLEVGPISAPQPPASAAKSETTKTAAKPKAATRLSRHESQSRSHRR
jgi:hypothetical protein